MVRHYSFEHGVVVFAGSFQGDSSVGEAFDGSQYHHGKHRHAINHLVEAQAFVV